jgi:maleylacetate reductase
MNRFGIAVKTGEQCFGAGCLTELPERLSRFGSRAMLIGSATVRSKAQLDQIADLLGEKCVGICTEAGPYIYPEQVRNARDQAASLKADIIVTVGGGGPIGYGKMAVYESKLPLACVVTTYSASECTAVQTMIENGTKVMYSAEHMRPSLRIYDPLLSMKVKQIGPRLQRRILHKNC